MTVKWVTGKVGAGKGLYCDYEMLKYYRAGRRVVTNYPVDTFLLGADSDNPVTVIPCHPRIEDFHFLGRGCAEGEKENFGAIFLDEAGTWLNSRTYADKSRLLLIDWFIHSRKLGWDVFIIVQNEEMIDKQIGLAAGEMLITCKRSDRARTVLFRLIARLLFGVKNSNPAAKKTGFFRHRVIVEIYHERKSKRDKPFEKFSFYADSYFGIHDTNFIFTDGFELINTDGGLKRVDARAVYTLLPGSYIRRMYHSDDAAVKSPVISQGRFCSILFFTSGTLFCWYFLIHNKNHHPPVTASVSSPVSAVTASAAAVTDIPPPAASAAAALSSSWRLTGYLKMSSGSCYIIRDNSGNIRYIKSDIPWDGIYSEIVVDGELVTFYTGNIISGQSSRDSVSPLPDVISLSGGKKSSR